MARKKYKMFPLADIGASGFVTPDGIFNINDTTAQAITSIAIVTDRPDMVTYRGSFRMELSGEPLYPDGMPARVLLLGGQNVDPDKRYPSRIGRLNYGNGILTVRYSDKNTAALAFAPYSVSVLVEYELK